MPQESDFNHWHERKKAIHFDEELQPFFREGEIRWAAIGQNIGTEIFGKGTTFSRHVLILRKVYGHSCLAIPLTSQKKEGSYYHQFTDHKGKTYYALLTQIRYVDGRRILGKMSFVEPEIFTEVQEAFFAMIKNIPLT